MNGVRLVRIILAKELREVLRDRRTLFLMIGIPVFLYPALFILMEQVTLFGQDAMEQSTPVVGVSPELSPEVRAALDGGRLRVVEVVGDLEGAVRDGRLDAAVAQAAPADPNGSVALRILYDASRDPSQFARALVAERLAEYADQALIERLARAGLPAEFAQPVAIEETSVATPAGLGGAALGRFLPLILILMVVLGAFHPAIDVTAGERERRTLEPLLTTPAPPGAVVIGKYLAVAAIAFTAAGLNLGSMLLTLRSGLFQLTQALDIEFSIPLGAIVLILFLLALMALLFAALFMGIAVGAQSFREAQTMLTPAYMVSFLPAIVTMAPGIAFTPTMALVPVAGVALLFRALMAGDPVGLEGLLAIASTLTYVALALAFAARRFGREDVLWGDDRDAQVRRQGRRPIGWRSGAGSRVPAPRTALLFAAGVAVLFFYVGRLFAGWGEPGILASQWLLLALPALLLVGLGGYRPRDTFGIRPAPARAFAAAGLLALGAIPLGWTLVWLQSFVLELPEEFLAAMQGLLTATDGWRLVWLLLLVALTPALCEELVFRGVLLRGLLTGMRPWPALLASAAIFGAFHLSFETALRFLPTAMLGLLIGYVAWRTGSIFPGMLMHFVNNGAVVLLLFAPAIAERALTAGGAPNPALVVLGAVLVAAGLRLLPAGAEGRAEAPGPVLAGGPAGAVGK